MAALSSVCASGGNGRLTPTDAYVLLDHLLDLSETNDDRALALQRYKQWASLQAKLIRAGSLSKEEMKTYLFSLFIAEERTKVDSLEEMAHTIVSRFTAQPELMLTVLNDMPFLQLPACDRIRAHFELFGSRKDKAQFLTDYEKMITQMLGKDHAVACLKQIRAP